MSTSLSRELGNSKSNTLVFQNKYSSHSWKSTNEFYSNRQSVIKDKSVKSDVLGLRNNNTNSGYWFSIIENSYSDIQYILNALEKAKAVSFDEDDEVLVQPVLECVWDLAKDFLIGYLEWINKNYGILIDAPDISALPNGSLDILWYNKNGKILINIDNSSDKKAYYYSDFHNRKNPMKGNVEINSEIDESLAIRIKKTMSND